MLVIRRPQKLRMLEVIQAPFLEKVGRIVDEAAPKGFDGVDALQQRQYILLLVDQAHRRGLSSERAVTQWVCLALEFGTDFDRSPALAFAYEGSSSQIDARFMTAVENAPEAVWAPRSSASIREQLEQLALGG
jgi:hypothetical protein